MYVYTYHCRLTNSLSLDIVANNREHADFLAESKLRQAEDLGFTMPAFHSFEYVTERELTK